jgi:hypothetical protein
MTKNYNLELMSLRDNALLIAKILEGKNKKG